MGANAILSAWRFYPVESPICSGLNPCNHAGGFRLAIYRYGYVSFARPGQLILPDLPLCDPQMLPFAYKSKHLINSPVLAEIKT
jgi:hypothetical protein